MTRFYQITDVFFSHNYKDIPKGDSQRGNRIHGDMGE